MRIFVISAILSFLSITSFSQWDYVAANASYTPSPTVLIGSTGSFVTTSYSGLPINYDDDISSVQDIGFNFIYNGISYNQFVISTNGFIKFGSTPPNSNDYNVYTSGESNVIAPLNMDLEGGTMPLITIKTFNNGQLGTKICLIEWRNMKDKSGFYSKLTFQIKLTEATNEINLSYSLPTVTNTPGIINPFIGLIGSNINNSISVTKATGAAWSNVTFIDGITNLTFSSNQFATPINNSSYRFRSTSFLPVTLQAFEAISSGSSVKISWATSQELNADRFEIQRSHDGINFETLDAVTAIGNSSTPSRYSYYDRAPRQGLNFYRLKMIDLDQRFALSDIKRINFSNNEAQINVTNPVADVLHVTASGIVNNERPMVFIYDFNGRLLLQKSWNNYPSDLNIDVSSLKSGMYLMQASINDDKVTKKFLKQ